MKVVYRVSVNVSDDEQAPHPSQEMGAEWVHVAADDVEHAIQLVREDPELGSHRHFVVSSVEPVLDLGDVIGLPAQVIETEVVE